MKLYGEGSSLMGSASEMVPPQNLEAEQKVICGCMLDNDVIDDIALILRHEDFYRDSHQMIWRALTWLRNNGKPVDCTTLAETLIRYKQFDKVGGDLYLGQIMASSPHAANTKYHAEIVREKSVSRQLIQMATELIKDGYSGAFTSGQLLESAERKIFGIGESRHDDSTMTIGEMLGRAKMLIDSRKKGEVCGVMTGFPRIDGMTGGFRPGQLIIVAARPGQGKTALAMQLAMNAGELYSSLVFSMEMSHEELGLRTLATLSEINSKVFDDPKGLIFAAMVSSETVTIPPVERLSEADERKLIKAIAEGSRKNVLIDDAPDRSVAQIAAKARRIKRQTGLGIVIVDYLSLVGGERLYSENRQEEVARNSRGLKGLAKHLGVPIILLSQLNRKNEERTDKRPMLSDLRESGQVEQDADVVLLLHRPEYYDPNDQPGVAEVIVAKNRNGPTGTVRLVFKKEYTKFLRDEYEEVSYQ